MTRIISIGIKTTGIKISSLAGLYCLLACCTFSENPAENPSENQSQAKTGQWMSMFNGKDLKEWTIKFSGHEVGINYKDTFRVENGVMKVSYENYAKFDGEFGHIFYNTPYSHYRMRMEYRFIDAQAPEAPAWAFRNSGIMIHSPPPQTMGLDQDFPVCIEVQMLGGNGTDARTTGNICSPGSHVTIDGQLNKNHCINSTSKTFHGDQWVKIEIEVLGNKAIRHFINDELVFDYGKPTLDTQDKDAAALISKGAPVAMAGGYISLQAETHPVEYRNIEIMPLEGNRSESWP